jgi:hypothetical protein
MLAKDSVKKSIAELLPKEEEDIKVITQAFQAERPDNISWKDLRGYTELSLRLKGYLNDNSNTTNVNIGLKLE